MNLALKRKKENNAVQEWTLGTSNSEVLVAFCHLGSSHKSAQAQSPFQKKTFKKVWLDPMRPMKSSVPAPIIGSEN